MPDDTVAVTGPLATSGKGDSWRFREEMRTIGSRCFALSSAMPCGPSCRHGPGTGSGRAYPGGSVTIRRCGETRGPAMSGGSKRSMSGSRPWISHSRGTPFPEVDRPEASSGPKKRQSTSGWGLVCFRKAVRARRGRKSEPQPDALLRILPECGGRTRNVKGFIQGAPELIVEVSKATRYVDLGPKLTDYEQAGVLEYVVHALDPDEVIWFKQDQGTLDQRMVLADGIYRSVAFPGLWLDPLALLNNDGRRLRAVLDLGCATPEHAAFVAGLAEQRNAP
jgi:hypothetical protein